MPFDILIPKNHTKVIIAIVEGVKNKPQSSWNHLRSQVEDLATTVNSRKFRPPPPPPPP